MGGGRCISRDHSPRSISSSSVDASRGPSSFAAATDCLSATASLAALAESFILSFICSFRICHDAVNWQSIIGGATIIVCRIDVAVRRCAVRPFGSCGKLVTNAHECEFGYLLEREL
eukprot:GHVU01093583.1.p1 GENE.GHVU01093583.1~~GHVU01093583.1.p1  ORF type:complete len:117 (+),score=2.84 GHVU01093583.1:295-645(+)